MDKRNFLFPFMQHYFQIFDQKFTDKLKKLKKIRKEMVTNKNENKDLFIEHCAGSLDLFKATDFYTLVNKRELFNKKGFIMIIFRDIMVKYYTREEEALLDFQERDEYFAKDRKGEGSLKKKDKTIEPKKNPKKIKPSRRNDMNDLNSDDEEMNSRKRGQTNKGFDEMMDEEDSSANEESKDEDSHSESERSFIEENDQIGNQQRAVFKPFMISFFEEYCEKMYDRFSKDSSKADLENKMSELLCYFTCMNEMDQEIMFMLFKATKHIKFKSNFGEILIKDVTDEKLPLKEMLLNHQLINNVILSLFSNFREAIKEVASSKISKLFLSITDLYNKISSNKNFKLFLKEKLKKKPFESYSEKLEYFKIIGNFYNKRINYFGGEQIKLLFGMLWKADDVGVVLFQNIPELKTTNTEMKEINDKNKGWNTFKVSGNFLDLFLNVNEGHADLRTIIENNNSKEDNNSKKNKLSKLKKNSEEFSSIAERLILLGVLTKMNEEPIFQELLHFFFCKFVNVIVMDKLNLTHQGNFSINSCPKRDDNVDSDESHIINTFAVLIGLSRNMLRMINYIITEVKEHKNHYRKILSYLHALKNNNFITILIDKLIQNYIEQLKNETKFEQLLEYIEKDKIKKSEITIINNHDNSLGQGNV